MKTTYHLDLADILCFEFECHRCHNRLTYNQHADTDFPGKCPACGEVWIPGGPNPHPISLMIGHLADAKRKLPSCNFDLRIEIAAPPKPVAEEASKK